MLSFNKVSKYSRFQFIALSSLEMSFDFKEIEWYYQHESTKSKNVQYLELRSLLMETREKWSKT